jgi:hypothetical protein
MTSQNFPASYAQTAWRRLLLFYHLPGAITLDLNMVQVELYPFNDCVLNRDLVLLSERVDQTAPRLPAGRRLSFSIHMTGCTLALQQRIKIK